MMNRQLLTCWRFGTKVEGRWRTGAGSRLNIAARSCDEVRCWVASTTTRNPPSGSSAMNLSIQVLRSFGSVCLTYVGCIGPFSLCFELRPGFVNGVERRLGHTAEACEAARCHDIADARLAGLRAERQADILGKRIGC